MAVFGHFLTIFRVFRPNRVKKPARFWLNLARMAKIGQNGQFYAKWPFLAISGRFEDLWPKTRWFSDVFAENR